MNTSWMGSCAATRLGLMAALALALGVGPSDASAQFGLPKIPKLSKTGKKDAPPQAAKPQGPPPQVAAISPNSVPPGWEGDVILTGTNFSKTMKLRMQCGYQSVKTVKFMVESAERAVLSLKISPTSEEEKCTIVLEVPPEATAETGPTVEGTPQIVQVTGATFAIADSASYAKPFQACFLAEGDVPVMELMMKLSQAMQQSSQDPCKLLVSSASVKYASQGKTILDQPASAVKTVDQVLMMGNPIGVFRIVLTNGKIYNFFASGSQSSDDPLFEQIKRRLNK